MLVQDQTRKSILKEAASGWVAGCKQPVILKDKTSIKKKIRQWAYHIILKEKT